jgi:hypothetical protein
MRTQHAGWYTDKRVTRSIARAIARTWRRGDVGQRLLPASVSQPRNLFPRMQVSLRPRRTRRTQSESTLAAITNMTQLTENKQSGPFPIETIFIILRPAISQFDSTSPRPTDYYALPTSRCSRCPCASIARSAKIRCSRTRMTHTVRHNQ